MAERKPRMSDWTRDQLVEKINDLQAELAYFREFIRTRCPGETPNYLSRAKLKAMADDGVPSKEIAKLAGLSATRVERRLRALQLK